MKELIPKHYCHQLVHSSSASKINDGSGSAVRNSKLYHNVLTHFPGDAVIQPRAFLIKEMTEEYFK